jgi:hypothetical protein
VFGKSLDKWVDDLLGAIESRDDTRFFAVIQEVSRATPKARREEVQAALVRLVPVLKPLSVRLL